MIVRQFLHWVRNAPAADRAEASGNLARAYLYSDLSPDDRAAAEGALIMLLDDPSPLVRGELARALAFSENAPAAVVHGLASDQPDIATWVLEHSPLLVDADLVDLVATGTPDVQMAVANRASLPCAVSAAIAEVGAAEACLVLIENLDAEIVPFSFDRIVERFGHLPVIRESMLLRDDLPAVTRQHMVAKLSETLVSFVTSRAWLETGRAQRVVREAGEKGTVTVGATAPNGEVRPLIRHLRESGQLNAGLVLRALLSGNVAMFEEALADLSGMPIARVSALVHDGGSAGFRAMFDRAGLPVSTYPAFLEAVEALREGGFVGHISGATRLKRRMVERVLTRCADHDGVDIEPLLTLLRRFAAEAAREEARLLCDGLVQDDAFDRGYEDDCDDYDGHYEYRRAAA